MLHAALALALLAGLSSLMVLKSVEAAQGSSSDAKPVVTLETSMGNIVVELDRAKAPITVDNFLKYVDKGFYDGLAFHRVIQGFMVQTGGIADAGGTLKEKREGAFAPIKNESGNGLSNLRGTLAMARTSEPDSATSQFFINHADNKPLDNYGGGYAVFGKVVSGMDVVDKIANVRTTVKRDSSGQPHKDVPEEAVVLKKATRGGKGAAPAPK